MATTRLRKAFRYPTDDEDEAEELDEEHQEQLIATLQAEDAARNDLYRKLFLIIPITAALFFAYTFVVSSTAQQQLIALLSLSSLGCTAYILHFMPLQAPARKGKTPMYRLDAAKGPVERYIVHLNAGLAVVLLLASGLSWRRGARDDAWQQALPAIILGLTIAVRQQLRPLDLEELQRAKYDYKGA